MNRLQTLFINASVLHRFITLFKMKVVVNKSFCKTFQVSTKSEEIDDSKSVLIVSNV